MVISIYNYTRSGMESDNDLICSVVFGTLKKWIDLVSDQYNLNLLLFSMKGFFLTKVLVCRHFHSMKMRSVTVRLSWRPLHLLLVQQNRCPVLGRRIMNHWEHSVPSQPPNYSKNLISVEVCQHVHIYSGLESLQLLRDR